MSTTQNEVWQRALNSCDLQQERHREVVFNNLTTKQPKNASLVFKDPGLGGFYKIPLGKVKVKTHDTGSVKENVIVPVVPMLYTTPDRDKFEALPARKGWVYIFRKKHLWRELEVVERSYLRDVNLTRYQGKDRRPATCELDSRIALPYKIGGVDQEIEIAFSEVQWSWDYINTLGGMDKKDPRLKKSTKLASENTEKYAKGVRDTRLTKINNLKDYSSLFTASPSQSDISSVENISDTLHKKIHFPSEVGAVFIPDPIGISRKLALQHENAWAELSELVESLRTGVKPDPSKSVFIKKASSTTIQTTEEKEIAAQYDVLALLYRVAFGSKEGKEKMGEHMKKDMFTTLLASKERSELRGKLTKYRNELTNYLNNDEYQRSLADFINNTPERQLEGKGWVALTLRMLATPIHALDVHLDLPEEIHISKNDSGEKYVKDTYGALNHAGAVLRVTSKITPKDIAVLPSGFDNKEITELMGQAAAPVTAKLLAALDNKGMDILSKVTGITTAIVDGLASQTIKEKTQLRELVAVINSIQVPGFPEFKLSSQTYSQIKLPENFEVVSQNKFKLKQTAPAKLVYPTTNYVSYVSGDYGLILKGRSLQVMPALVSTTEIYVDQIIQKDVPSKSLQSSVARNIRSSKLYGRGFGGFLMILELINIKNAIKQTSEAAQKGGHLKSNINWVGTISGTGATLAYVTELYAKSISRKALEMSMASAGKWFGKIAAVPAAFLTAWEASTNFEEGDTDAGIAYSVAAIATFAVVFANPLGAAILVGIALGALIFAWFLEDDPLERFSKNGPVNRERKIPSGGNLWAKLSNSAKSTGVKKKFKKWQTWRSVRQEMFDYFQAFETKIRVNRELERINPDLDRDGTVTTGERIKATLAGGFVNSLIAKTVDVTVKPRDFHPFLSDIDFYCRYYEKGVGKSVGIELEIISLKTEVDKKSGKVKKIDLSFGFPTTVKPYDDEFSDIMFCCRMRQNKSGGQFVPVNSEAGDARFIAVKRKANSVQSTDGRAGIVPDDNPDWSMEHGVNTLKVLETAEHWKKK